ncbi:hypothetical protein L195_g051109, partial [Trifolium pratense]
MDRFRSVAACSIGNRLRYSTMLSNVQIRALLVRTEIVCATRNWSQLSKSAP